MRWHEIHGTTPGFLLSPLENRHDFNFLLIGFLSVMVVLIDFDLSEVDELRAGVAEVSEAAGRLRTLVQVA